MLPGNNLRDNSFMSPSPPTSRKKAIEEKCKECIYDPQSGNGTWRQQVGNCSTNNCPLFNVRPTPTVSTKK